MFACLQNLCIEILTQKVMVIGGEASGKRLAPEDRALLSGSSALIKEALKRASLLHQVKPQHVCSPEEGPHPTVLVPRAGTSSLQNGKISISIVCKSPRAWCFVAAAQMD